MQLEFIMRDEYEDDGICEAFNQLFNTIQDLQKIENRIRYQNKTALEKCKSEIECLFLEQEKKRGEILY